MNMHTSFESAHLIFFIAHPRSRRKRPHSAVWGAIVRKSDSSLIVGCIVDPRPVLRELSIDPFESCVTHWFTIRVLVYTRKYMHAETLADKTIVFSEREVFKVVVMVTQFFKKIFTNEKSPKNITLNYKIINFPNIYMFIGILLYVI
jgi:hypothetical protein